MQLILWEKWVRFCSAVVGTDLNCGPVGNHFIFADASRSLQWHKIKTHLGFYVTKPVISHREEQRAAICGFETQQSLFIKWEVAVITGNKRQSADINGRIKCGRKLDFKCKLNPTGGKSPQTSHMQSTVSEFHLLHVLPVFAVCVCMCVRVWDRGLQGRCCAELSEARKFYEQPQISKLKTKLQK